MMEKGTQNTMCSHLLGIVSQLNKFNTIPSQIYPIFKNDLYNDTFQRSFLAIIKAPGLYDVADPDYDPGDGDHYEQELFQENNLLFILYWLLLFRQTRGESWSRNMKGMQDPSFQNYTIIILSQMLHNMRLSL